MLTEPSTFPFHFDPFLANLPKPAYVSDCSSAPTDYFDSDIIITKWLLISLPRNLSNRMFKSPCHLDIGYDLLTVLPVGIEEQRSRASGEVGRGQQQPMEELTGSVVCWWQAIRPTCIGPVDSVVREYSTDLRLVERGTDIARQIAPALNQSIHLPAVQYPRHCSDRPAGVGLDCVDGCGVPSVARDGIRLGFSG